MPRRRFYAPPVAFAPDGARVSLSAEETAHLVNVLRLRVGDEAFVFDGAGREFRGRVVELERGRTGRATLVIEQEVAPQRPESQLSLTLACALLKGEKFDLVIQKATELGVRAVVPVVTARADVRLRAPHDTETRVARWQRLALEAAKQSGRARVPAVCPPAPLPELLTDAAANATTKARLFFTERAGRGWRETINELPADLNALTVLTGPEGGWADEELALARTSGWQLLMLGGRILRAETAAVVACTLVQHAFGDLR